MAEVLRVGRKMKINPIPRAPFPDYKARRAACMANPELPSRFRDLMDELNPEQCFRTVEVIRDSGFPPWGTPPTDTGPAGSPYVVAVKGLRAVSGWGLRNCKDFMDWLVGCQDFGGLPPAVSRRAAELEEASRAALVAKACEWALSWKIEMGERARVILDIAEDMDLADSGPTEVPEVPKDHKEVLPEAPAPFLAGLDLISEEACARFARAAWRLLDDPMDKIKAIKELRDAHAYEHAVTRLGLRDAKDMVDWLHDAGHGAACRRELLAKATRWAVLWDDDGRPEVREVAKYVLDLGPRPPDTGTAGHARFLAALGELPGEVRVRVVYAVWGHLDPLKRHEVILKASYLLEHWGLPGVTAFVDNLIGSRPCREALIASACEWIEGLGDDTCLDKELGIAIGFTLGIRDMEARRTDGEPFSGRPEGKRRPAFIIVRATPSWSFPTPGLDEGAPPPVQIYPTAYQTPEEAKEKARHFGLVASDGWHVIGVNVDG